MTRAILLGVLLTVLAGCGTDYTREIRATEPLGNHRFTRVEFAQGGHVLPLNRYEWAPVSGFTLVADDGWRLVVNGPSMTGYNWSPEPDRKNNPVYFIPGSGDRLTLIDPQGGMHPVKVTVGELSPRPAPVTQYDSLWYAKQPAAKK